MNTSKNIPGKFLAENCVEMRVSNFAKKHGKEIIPDSREVCKITSTTRPLYLQGRIAKRRRPLRIQIRRSIQRMALPQYRWKLYGPSHLRRQKSHIRARRIQENELKEEFRVNRKNLRCKTNGAGILILAKA